MKKPKAKKIRKLGNSPQYNPAKWKHALGAGCYPYAINVFLDDFYLIGDFLGSRCSTNVSNDELISVMKYELEEIWNYKVTEVDLQHPCHENEFKIYLEREMNTGYYHFYRQDTNGEWSDKLPGELPKECFFFLQEIEQKKKRKSMCLSYTGWCFLITEEKE